ncbi:MAG: hypothetical protein IT426_20985 [Pirellulales bacterium]|nr:hypothetical protein [Pirellulales bacterium]
MPTVVQEFTGNSDSVVRALGRALDMCKKNEAGLKKLTDQTKGVDTEFQKLERTAARLANAVLTPQEKHAAKVAEINALYGKQLITLDQQKRGITLADAALRKQVGGASELSQGFALAGQKAAEIGIAIVGVGGVVGAIGLAKTAYMDWRQEIQKLGQEHAKFAKEFTVDLAKIADASQGPEISGWLESGRGGTAEQKRLLFKGLTEEQPGVPLSQRKAIVEQGIRALPLLQESERETFGHALGNLYDPSLPPQANVSKTFLARALAADHAADLGGDRFEKLQATLAGAGMERNEATGLLIQSMLSGDAKAGALKAAVAAIDTDYELNDMPRKTADDLAKRKFAAASREDRLKFLIGDKGVRKAVLADQAALFAGIDFSRGQEFGKQLTAAEKGDAIGEALRRVSQTPEGLQTIESQKLAVDKFNIGAENRRLGSRLERADERFAALNASEGWFHSALNKFDWELSKEYNPNSPERAYVRKKIGGFDPDSRKNLLPEWREFYKAAEREEAVIAAAREDARRAEELARQQVDELRSINRKLSAPHPTAVQNNIKQHGEGGR